MKRGLLARVLGTDGLIFGRRLAAKCGGRQRRSRADGDAGKEAGGQGRVTKAAVASVGIRRLLSGVPTSQAAFCCWGENLSASSQDWSESSSTPKGSFHKLHRYSCTGHLARDAQGPMFCARTVWKPLRRTTFEVCFPCACEPCDLHAG